MQWSDRPVKDGATGDASDGVYRNPHGDVEAIVEVQIASPTTGRSGLGSCADSGRASQGGVAERWSHASRLVKKARLGAIVRAPGDRAQEPSDRGQPPCCGSRSRAVNPTSWTLRERWSDHYRGACKSVPAHAPRSSAPISDARENYDGEAP